MTNLYLKADHTLSNIPDVDATTEMIFSDWTEPQIEAVLYRVSGAVETFLDGATITLDPLPAPDDYENYDYIFNDTYPVEEGDFLRLRLTPLNGTGTIHTYDSAVLSEGVTSVSAGMLDLAIYYDSSAGELQIMYDLNPPYSIFNDVNEQWPPGEGAPYLKVIHIKR